MHRFGLIVAFSLAAATPAAAEVIAACGHLASQQAERTHGAAGLRATQLLLSEQPAPLPKTPIALWRDSAGFDVLLNWGAQNQRSLRAEGAEIIGNEAGAGSVHLIVARSETPSLEHFLFSFGNSITGRLRCLKYILLRNIGTEFCQFSFPRNTKCSKALQIRITNLNAV